MALAFDVLYIRDNSTLHTETGMAQESIPGSIGWSGITAWAASAGSITTGTIRRQTSGSFVGTGSRSLSVVTISAVTSGLIYLGMALFTAAGAAVGTVTSFGTGTGGTGTYNVGSSGTIASTTINGGFSHGNQLAFIATQAATGTTAATEPNWSQGSARGATFTDNTVTWIECTGQAGVNGDITNTPNWTSVKNTAPTRGSVIKDNAGTHLFIQTSAGGTTGNGAEPSWNVAAVGNTTTDNTVTWTYIGTSFSSWAAPLATLTQGSSWIVGDQTLYLGDDHNEIWQALVTVPGVSTLTGTTLLSIDHTVSLPPGSADLKAGAIISTKGANGITMNNGYWYGITFWLAVGGSASQVVLSFGSSATHKFENCTFKTSATGVGSTFSFQSSTPEVINSSFIFGAAGQTLTASPDRYLYFYNCSTFFGGGSSVPTILFGSSGTGGDVILEGCDLSSLNTQIVPAGSSGSFFANYVIVDCKLHASVTIASTPVERRAGTTDVVRSSSDSKTYIQRRIRFAGNLNEEATIIRTGGASDGTTGISWKIVTNANALFQWPFVSFPVMIWNPTTGSNVVVTMYGIWNAAALPNNNDIWVDVEYLGDATPTPLGTYKSGAATNILNSGSAQAADTSAWDSQVTARANTHAYSVGDVYKSANNAGRIFFVTTAGTSSGSEPGGIATAVDGGSVTDGTAIVRAGMRFTLTVTLTSTQPQLAGYLKAIVKAAKLSSTFYVDPAITLS